MRQVEFTCCLPPWGLLCLRLRCSGKAHSLDPSYRCCDTTAIVYVLLLGITRPQTRAQPSDHAGAASPFDIIFSLSRSCKPISWAPLTALLTATVNGIAGPIGVASMVELHRQAVSHASTKILIDVVTDHIRDTRFGELTKTSPNYWKAARSCIFDILDDTSSRENSLPCCSHANHALQGLTLHRSAR